METFSEEKLGILKEKLPSREKVFLRIFDTNIPAKNSKNDFCYSPPWSLSASSLRL